MARTRLHRPHVIKTTALAWSVWRALPPSQRRALYQFLRRHGPYLVSRELRRKR
jgi:hypothetical protein